MLQQSHLLQLLFSLFAHVLCSVTRYDDVRVLHEIQSPNDRWLLLSDTNSVRVCSITNFMQLSVKKKRHSCVCRKTSRRGFDCRLLCEPSITSTDRISDEGECLQTQTVFHQHADNIFSQTFIVCGH